MNPLKLFNSTVAVFVEADRASVIDAVCDAIEGFCSEPVTILPGPLSWPFDYIDGFRIVAQFDILKEEGV